MTTLKRVILNGTTLYPTTIDVDEVEIANTKRMLDGTMRKYHRAFKNKWSLGWTSVPETSIAAIRALYRTTTSMTYNNEDNTNFTVITTGFTTKLSADNISRAGIIYYDVTLTFEEQ